VNIACTFELSWRAMATLARASAVVMDMEGEDCFAVPIPQRTSSGGKSFSHSGVFVGPLAVAAEDDPHPVSAAIITAANSTLNLFNVIFIKTPFWFYNQNFY
jgi:hypothetical protein